MNLGMVGAIGGVGKALVTRAEDIGRAEDEARKLEGQKGLQMFLLKAKQEFDLDTQVRTEAIKNAPLLRVGAKARELAGQEVAAEIPATTQLSGIIPLAPGEMGPQRTGFKGDIAAVRADLEKLPDGPDKEAAIAQLEKQAAGDTSLDRTLGAGRTRKRTADEAFDAALADAKVNDPVAYAAAKPLATDKTMIVPEGATVIGTDGKPRFSSAGSKADREAVKEAAKVKAAEVAEAARDERLRVTLEAADARQRAQLESAERKADTKAATLKPLPIAYANGLLENNTNLRRAQKALDLVNGLDVGEAKGDQEATGVKGYLPNQLLNRIDPKGVAARAAIADLGSLVIHERSGAAVTAAEFPRLAPFIPSEKDDAATVKKKLGLFVQNYKATIEESIEFYKESGYKVPPMGATASPAAEKGGDATGWSITEVPSK